MSRFQSKKLSKEAKANLLNELWVSISLLDSPASAKGLFSDLLSESEAIMLARRIRIARFLLQGMSYDEIFEKTEASATTISHVHRWLQNEESGYQKVLPKLEKVLIKKKGTVDDEPSQQFTFPWLKKKYPMHFLLFNLIDYYKNK